VVKAGDIVRVKVLEVDIPRKRIALTMRMSDEVRPQQTSQERVPNRALAKSRQAEPAGGSMADALAKALRRN
jgi:uncharacterized protein